MMEYLPIVALSLSIIALLVSFLSYRDSHRHKRVFDTINIIGEWDSEAVLNARAKVTQLKDYRDINLPKAISRDLILDQRKRDFEDDDNLLTITDHINILLNYMNLVALGIESGVYDGDLVKNALSQTFSRHYNALREYREESESVDIRLDDPWPELKELLARWKEIPKKRNVRAPGEVT